MLLQKTNSLVALLEALFAPKVRPIRRLSSFIVSTPLDEINHFGALTATVRSA